MKPWANPIIVLPAALLVVLAMARFARLRPLFRPLLAPFSATIAALVLLLLASRDQMPAGWVAVVFLVPVLVLLVRASVLAFQAVFRSRQGTPPPSLLESVIAVVLYGLGAGFVAHRFLGVELTPFLATSAVVGAVVGLALQDTLGNLFAGIALHTEAPFRVGDWVRVAEQEGRVEQVSWRAMRLLTWSQDTLTIPNNHVARSPILNYSQPREPHSRVLLMGVNYHTPPNKALSVLAGLLEQVVEVSRVPPPTVRIVGYHDFYIQYEIRYHVAGYEEYRRAEGEIFRLIWYHFRRHGIEIPYPVRNVFLHQVENSADAKDGAASRLERALRAIDLFRPLSEEELRAAAARFRHLHYAAGEEIIDEGAPGDSFFVIDRGEVEVGKTIGGTWRRLARLMEGQFFGEMALLTGEARAARVVAATDVDLFTIDKAGFHDILVANPAIAVDISAILAERREALSQAQDASGRGADSPHARSELKERILDRIRSYFGL